MSYKIEYSPETAHCYPQRDTHQKSYIGRWFCIILVIGAILWMRVNGVPDFLIPGDPEITKSAAVALMDDLSEGVNVNDAVTSFCRSILDGAGV